MADQRESEVMFRGEYRLRRAPSGKHPAPLKGIELLRGEEGIPDSLANAHDLLQVSAIRKLWVACAVRVLGKFQV